ncbi:hypothetical protein PINS_up004176 [Pythium insidiosum]|nr:hypothetical protein PINS_up004176 [Pythium insidiosum]
MDNSLCHELIGTYTIDEQRSVASSHSHKFQNVQLSFENAAQCDGEGDAVGRVGLGVTVDGEDVCGVAMGVGIGSGDGRGVTELVGAGDGFGPLPRAIAF